MLQIESQRKQMDDYKQKYISNRAVEWLIEHGEVHQNVYFKGACGDRYTIYVATKRNKNVVDFHTVFNGYDYGTLDGVWIASIKDYTLKMYGSVPYWRGSTGHTLKQLMRQGIHPKSHKKEWRMRYCRSAFMMRLHDNTEFTPWSGMKINLKTGLLVNKPNRKAMKKYKGAKDTDSRLRKQNRIANKNNTEALGRYHKAEGNFALLPMDDVFKHRNVEYRTDILNFYGLEKLLATLNTKVEDEDTIDGRFYRLINVEIPDLASGQERHDWGLYLEMINPSTGESHFEGVANTVGTTGRSWSGNIETATVKAALSWRDGDGQMQTGQTWNAKSTSANYVKPIKLT